MTLLRVMFVLNHYGIGRLPKVTSFIVKVLLRLSI